MGLVLSCSSLLSRLLEGLGILMILAVVIVVFWILLVERDLRKRDGRF